jgi:hypothetical protein
MDCIARATYTPLLSRALSAGCARNPIGTAPDGVVAI